MPDPPHCGRRRRRPAPRPSLGGSSTNLRLDRNPHLNPGQRVREQEPHVGLEIGAAIRLRPASTLPPRRDPAELAEEIREVDVLLQTGPRRSATRPGRAEGVVLLPLLGVGERLVRRLHLLEALLRPASSGLRSGWYLRASLR